MLRAIADRLQTGLLPPHTPTLYAMAKLNEYLVILPDLPGVLQKRLGLRAKHFARIEADTQAGIITFGGGLLKEHGKEGEPPQVKGSTMTILAESEAAVWERVRSDEFAINGVWDVDRVEIYPFRTAIRLPL